MRLQQISHLFPLYPTNPIRSIYFPSPPLTPAQTHRYSPLSRIIPTLQQYPAQSLLLPDSCTVGERRREWGVPCLNSLHRFNIPRRAPSFVKPRPDLKHSLRLRPPALSGSAATFPRSEYVVSADEGITSSVNHKGAHKFSDDC